MALLSIFFLTNLLSGVLGGNFLTSASMNQLPVILDYFPPKGGAAAIKFHSNNTFQNSTVSANLYATSPSSASSGDDLSQSTQPTPLRVLFLSADTGGGHRASAEALAKQFQHLFPGSTYDLLDVWSLDGVYPYKTLVKSYKHLSAHPRQWRFFYHFSNTAPNSILANFHSNLMCERRIRRRIAQYDPDVIVSVHPAMNHAPRRAVRNLSRQYSKHIPFFTVVTDLGSGHNMWFHRTVDKLYVASEKLRRLAKRRGWAPDSKIVMAGLPIRQDFALQAERMGSGGRTSTEGQLYRKQMKGELGLKTDKPMVLVMGGGEGVGSLSNIVNELYIKFRKQGIDATICVVCGRNQQLKKELEERDWDQMMQDEETESKQKPRFSFKRNGPARSKEIQDALDKTVDADEGSTHEGDVDIIGLGYVNKMAEFMVAADILVTKAGPGTIAEAASVGLPVMLTSFLPGQEAGNVEVVLDAGFGDFCQDPDLIAREVAVWLKDPELMETMSKNTAQVGSPYAAADIVQDIGTTTQAWMQINLEGSGGQRRSTNESGSSSP